MRAPSWRFEAIGTPWQIDTDLALGSDLRGRIERRVEDFDRTWSRFREDSLVSAIAATPGRYELPPDAERLFSLYGTLDALTGGAVNPLVGGSLDRLGYDHAYSLTPSGPPVAAPPWSSVEWAPPHLSTSEPVAIDIGAAGKGCLVDSVADILLTAGVDRFTVDASGDMVHRGSAPIRVALEHPGDPDLAIGVAELGDGALCASAVNRRVWGDDLHHVLDARTGEPVADVVATWVVSRSAIVADGLATALFFASTERLAEVFDFRYVRMRASGQVECSADFEGEIFR